MKYCECEQYTLPTIHFIGGETKTLTFPFDDPRVQLMDDLNCRFAIASYVNQVGTSLFSKSMWCDDDGTHVKLKSDDTLALNGKYVYQITTKFSDDVQIRQGLIYITRNNDQTGGDTPDPEEGRCPRSEQEIVFDLDGMVENGQLGWTCEARDEFESNVYLTFSSESPFTISIRNGEKNWDGRLDYSTDGRTWTEWDGTNEIASDDNQILLRGTGNTHFGIEDDEYTGFVFDGQSLIDCTGNIEALLDHKTVARGNHPTMGAYCFADLFSNPDYYYTPSLLASAPELPAMTLSEGCYRGMFFGCTSLTIAPELPAEQLAPSCYAGMFSSCTSLVTPPALRATSLAETCYNSMFYECGALTSLPALPAVELQEYCYMYMFQYCLNIRMSRTQTGAYQYEYRIPSSSATTGIDAYRARYYMFDATGGTFADTPSINTTYYTTNPPVS